MESRPADLRAPVSAARGALADFLHRSAGDLRDERVIAGVAGLAGPAHSMLDIGASDGRVAARVAARVGVEDVRGVDVELQPTTEIPVTTYDGHTLPFESGRFEVVTIVDVLHHCDDPAAVLAEALRVLGPDGRVVIKDHLRLGPWSDRVLYAMDTASNFGVHRRAAGRYLAPDEWVQLVDTAGGRLETMVWPFRVHDLPWRLVARDQYHLLLRVLPDGS